jgi:hypothetical protein
MEGFDDIFAGGIGRVALANLTARAALANANRKVGSAYLRRNDARMTHSILQFAFSFREFASRH